MKTYAVKNTEITPIPGDRSVFHTQGIYLRTVHEFLKKQNKNILTNTLLGESLLLNFRERFGRQGG
jgi:hypothetical protein